MNEYFQLIITIIGGITSIGILAGGCGYLYSSFKKGTREEKTDVISASQQVIDFWKEQAENFKAMLDTKEREWNQKFQELNKEIGMIQGQLNAERAQNENLEKIFQNRDPQHQEFMKFLIEAVTHQKDFNKEMVRILGEIHAATLNIEKEEGIVDTDVTSNE